MLRTDDKASRLKLIERRQAMRFRQALVRLTAGLPGLRHGADSWRNSDKPERG